MDAFRAECRRIVKLGGLIVIIYNHVPGKEMTDFGRRAVDSFLSNPVILTFDNPISYTKENWLAYIASQDDCPLPTDSGYEAHMAALSEMFDRDSVDGLLCCDRVTRVYIERMN